MVAMIARRRGVATLPAWLGPAALFTLVGLLVRLPLLGDPVSGTDEEFYLLVADKMAHGVLPYVGIWDRKPIGLFLIYRLALALPIPPVLAYELLGLAASVLTALTIERLARLIAPPRGALFAGLAYLLFQPAFNAALGQSPVFYNLPVALAALIVARAAALPGSAALLRRGLVAMLLLGVAMQIKYTVVFEGVALGLALLARARADDSPAAAIARMAAAWIFAALAPTLAVWAAYAAFGHGMTFVEANFLSIFSRGSSDGEEFQRLAGIAAMLLPFLILLTSGARSSGDDRSRRVIQFWALAAVVGFLLFGTWYDHYAAPLIVPLAVLCARALASRKFAAPLLLGIGAVLGLTVAVIQREKYGDAEDLAHADALIASGLNGGCLYVYEGHPAFYRTAPACIPTRFAFPAHLSTSLESNALGVDPVDEVRRIMAGHPDVVVTGAVEPPYMPYPATRAVLTDALEQGYERYAVIAIGEHHYALWRGKKDRPLAANISTPTAPRRN